MLLTDFDERQAIDMKYTIVKQDGFTVYSNENGPDIGVANISVIEKDGYIFKDLEKTGELLPYEDWRLDPEVRAKDLASRLSIDEIAGLMLYSPHQMVPSLPGEPFEDSYDGKTFYESGKEKWALTDQQKEFLKTDYVRHVLALKLEDTEIAARWNNEMQKYVEELPHGIPINLSSDPRHGAAEASAEFRSKAADVSRWPEGMGMAATFSPDLCKEYAKIISKEYRALGIATSLSPQIDLGTEPRWMRIEDTWGPHPKLVTDLTKAYCDGMQTTDDEESGWGRDSVCAMVKHWPGGGTGEGGRDGHYPFGKYAVYPRNNFDLHMEPFLNGAFKLEGPTGQAASLMPYYTVSWQQDKKNGKEVGNSYSEYIIKDLLREKHGYDGVVCTDWGITGDPEDKIDSFSSRCYGVEDLSEAERHFLAIENGIDQFGGNSDIKPVLEAYKIGCEKYGKGAMDERMKRSAVRLLRNMFRCGLFDNPYLDPEASKRVVACQEHCAAGYETQAKSVVLLKNQDVLPISERKKVYIPNRSIEARKTFFRQQGEPVDIDPIDWKIIEQYYERVDKPSEADFALIFIESPLGDGYSEGDLQMGGNGYVPISLQYRPYTAEYARDHSIAGGDFREKDENRGYQGKTNTVANEKDLDLVLQAKKELGDRPVIVCMHMHNPTVMSELEPYADGILIEFGVQKQVILDIISGAIEPSGLLPVQMPLSMEIVEKHYEDTPFDMEPYVDSAGNAYDFGYGMSWRGRIEDERTRKYVK